MKMKLQEGKSTEMKVKAVVHKAEEGGYWADVTPPKSTGVGPSQMMFQ